jgi:DNA-binding beta-propeller fold protein YncE
MKHSILRRALTTALVCSFYAGIAAGAIPQSLKGLMYVGTLDKKLLVINENSGDIAGEIPLGGIPRTTVLSADRTKVHVITTEMQVETVDLASRQVISSFPLSDGKSSPRMPRGAYGRNFSGLAVDPNGRYLYTTIALAVKEIDQYRIDPPQFVQIDLQEKRISKSLPFPKGYDQGFGFAATYKISPDGKLLYVFDDDIVVFNLDHLTEVDRIPLATPEYPGASPYRLAASDDPNDDPSKVTTVFTSIDPIVHRETLGLGVIDLTTRKVDFRPLGPAFPMIGFILTPDRKLGYSLMVNHTLGNREAEFWVWDVASHTVIKKAPVPARATFRLGMSSDGKKLYLYAAGSTIEFFDTSTLQSTKLLYLNKDTTTNLIVLPGT